ncbi:MAG: hypothetical protein ACT4P4_21880 [Betaproteobacteria bacterium]
MGRRKRKLTRKERIARAARKAAFMTIFANGKRSEFPGRPPSMG